MCRGVELMARANIVSRIVTNRLIAIVRLAQGVDLLRIADALHAGGVEVIEFTLGTPGALETLPATRQRFANTLDSLTDRFVHG